MNKAQTSQFRMFCATQNTLNNYSSLWTPIPALQAAKTEFDELIRHIETTNEASLADSEGVTRKKRELLLVLGQQVVVLSGALRAYAANTKNVAQAISFKIVKDNLMKARETEVEKLVAPILKFAQANLLVLTDYGITADQVAEAEATLKGFKALIGKPRVIRNKAYAAMTLLDKLLDETGELLKSKLDSLIVRFRFTNTEFYSAYQRARTIVD